MTQASSTIKNTLYGKGFLFDDEWRDDIDLFLDQAALPDWVKMAHLVTSEPESRQSDAPAEAAS